MQKQPPPAEVPVHLFFTRKYLKARTADPGKPSLTLLLVSGGREECSYNGCSPKLSITPGGRISIKADKPSSIVVFT